jgi:RNA recognition motif-containing protein
MFKNPSKKNTSSNLKQTTCKLFVGNLATHTTSTNLQTIFHTHGQIIECVKVRERYGFVRFSSNEEAQRALNACNGLQLNGYPMIVEYAQNEILISPKSPRVSSRYYSKKVPIPIVNMNDDIPLLSTDSHKFPVSTLNPDASSFTLACSTSDYYSQSDRPSSRSSSERSNCLSPSILSATLPLSYSDDDEEDDNYRKNINDQRQSLNIFIGDKILNLYGSNVDANNNQTSISFDGKFRIILKEKMITFFCQ